MAGQEIDLVIIDYGMGNLRNVQKAFEHIGVAARISSAAADLDRADALILPGVGAFGDAMDNLTSAGLVQPILNAVSQDKPLLGICLGLQLLFQESQEMGHHRGLGILAGSVVRFGDELKVPHIGWNQLDLADVQRPERALVKDILDRSYAYFVHSYYVQPADPACVLATTEYGNQRTYSIRFASIVGQGNVFGAQPHPEKSQEVGLQMLKNFADIAASQPRAGRDDHLSSD
jgi:glutamine amidotransferase